MRRVWGTRSWILALVLAAGGIGGVAGLQHHAMAATPAQRKIAGDAMPPVPQPLSSINLSSQSYGWWNQGS